MSEFKCLEPGCNYHVGIGGDVVTDEDFEQQDYYFQEIEEHQQMHVDEETRLDSVRARDLNIDHIGHGVEVLGELLELVKCDHTRGGIGVDLKKTSRNADCVPMVSLLQWTLDPNSMVRISRDVVG